MLDSARARNRGLHARTPLATPRDSPSVLFLTMNVEDYFSASLFHGLRTVLGDSVLDIPVSLGFGRDG
jgi:hypothetical protein